MEMYNGDEDEVMGCVSGQGILSQSLLDMLNARLETLSTDRDRIRE